MKGKAMSMTINILDYTHFKCHPGNPDMVSLVKVYPCEKCGAACEDPESTPWLGFPAQVLSDIKQVLKEGNDLRDLGWCEEFGGAVCEECTEC